MTARAPRRLPGIRFEVTAPPLPEELPRMDVAAFVGFAASGPIDVPVAVEDIAQFHAIYGLDAPIAWDTQGGETLYANLASAVRAFFRDGGERCWVVRVARRSSDPGGAHHAARANVFGLPGMFAYRAESHSLAPASALARSEGSWSDALRVATALESRSLSVLSQDLASGALVLGVSSAADLGVGDLLRVRFTSDPRLVYLPIDAIEIVGGPDGGSNLLRLSRVTVRARSGRPLWFEPDADGSPVLLATAPAGASTLQIRSCERLGFELLWRWGDGQPSRLSGLGFCPEHPRYWAALPSDHELFTELAEAGEHGTAAPRSADDHPQGALRARAADPRIPLAGPAVADGIFLPLTVAPLPELWSESGALPDDALVRDGLANFDAGLFLDAALVESTTTGLAAQADFLRYQSPTPRRLRGIHALFGVEEVTLVAVPDAVLRGWSPLVFEAPPAPHPQDPSPPPLPSSCGACDADRTFVDCDRRAPATPVLFAPDEADAAGSYSLSWSAIADAEYVLEESLSPDFDDPVNAYVGSARSIDFWGRAPGAYYYRVRARVEGVFSAWSAGRVVSVRPPGRFRLEPIEDYRPTTLLAVQRSLLRLCAARGDLFAALATPEHYLEEDAIVHAGQLRSAAEGSGGVAAIGFGEASALSYGALYYPWLTGREESRPDELRSTPPDGAALGILARRSIARGAWVAPANEPLAGVVALKPRIAAERFTALYDAQVNVFRMEPRGFLALGADTLSLEAELLPINVRRLLILVRRAALRLGQTYVFEPNDATFRRLIERSFESLLGQMYERGAFAGASADKAFQVVTGPALNPPGSVELGRFFVELRVAPSLPLSFITVRLVQSGDRSRVTEER